MMSEAKVLERFLKDVKDHTIESVREDGLHRHVVFSNNGSFCYRFGLVTWPGYLCIYGDMGEYVFSRIPDMFEFFRRHVVGPHAPLEINAGYWSEKVQAESRNNGVEKYSPDLFRAAVFKEFKNRITDRDEWPKFENFDAIGRRRKVDFKEMRKLRRKKRREIYDEIMGCAEDEHDAISAAMEYFDDFYEHDLKDYTQGYLWCLYAIVWGIRQFDDRPVEATPWSAY